MKEGSKLQAKLIDHGRSEIWLEVDGMEVTPRRTLATNEVLNVTRPHCAPEVFTAFYADYHIALGHVATLTTPNLSEIAAELCLMG